MCDMRIAAENARFSQAYVRLGLVPGDGGAYFLPRLVGMQKALELLLTGDFIDAREAERIGVVNKTVPLESLRDETFKLARRIASRPPLAVRMTKRLAYQSARTDLRTALEIASSHVAVIQQSKDHKEAVQAFREKRKGIYTGH
jgi:enoyl-CoA hydratase/carnithine racemase